MKTKFVLALLCLASIKANAQAIINLITHPTTSASKKSILDFGAIPNDGLDDTWAFIKAGRYFSNQWDINGKPLIAGQINVDYAINSAELEIPSGTYYVGRQIDLRSHTNPSALTYGQVFEPSVTPAVATTFINSNVSGSTNTLSFFMYGFELIDLFNVDKLIIRGVGTGTDRPVIKYNENLYIGYFNAAGTGHFWPLGTEVLDYQYQSSAGNFISTRNCRNISVANLEVDGNNTPFNAATGKGTIYNGGYGPHRIQSGASGLRLTNTQNVTLEDLKIHHMTMDGLILDDYYKNPDLYPQQDLSNLWADSVELDNNRRQGFSWIGGRHIIFNNSKFNNTSVSVASEPLAIGNPAAGIDIEPENNPDEKKLLCGDGIFNNCESVNNRGIALLDVEDAAELWRLRNFTFNSCYFYDNDVSYSVQVKGKNHTFNNCTIRGGFVYGNRGDVPGEETKFYSCIFEDAPAGSVYAGHQTLVESTGSAKRLLFSHCIFRTWQPNVKFFSLQANAASEAEFSVISNCTFTTHAGSYTGTAGTNFLYACTFDGTNTFTNLNTSADQVFSTNRLVFTGSADPCTPYQFNLNGKLLFIQANSNEAAQLAIPLIMGRNGIGSTANNGYFKFNINDKSCFYNYWGSVYDIGVNSTFSNNAGGQWCLLGGAGASINNSGKIILNEDSYTNFFNNVPNMPINTQAVGNPEFYYHKNAQMGLNANWINYSFFVGIGATVPLQNVVFNSLTKFDGGNPNIPSTSVTSVNDALNFTGTKSSVNIPDNPKFDFFKNGHSFSVELSFKSTATTSSRADILFSKGIAINIGLLPSTASQYPGSVFIATPSAGYIFPKSNYRDNLCHHIVISYNSAASTDNLIFSIDGNSSAYTIAPISIGSAGNDGYPILLGSYIGGHTLIMPGNIFNKSFWRGWVGQARIWDRALSEAEMCYNYKRKAPYLATGLMGDWDMTDDAGILVTDNSPNPVNGTITGNLTWLSQNDIGDCFTPQNNSNQLGNFRGGGASPLVVKYYEDNSNLPAVTASIAVTPNPNKGSFAVELKNITEPSVLTIKDISGKTVFSQSISLRAIPAPQTINVKSLPAGLYVLYVQNKKEVLTSKVIVQ